MADDSSLCDHCAFLFRQAEKAKEPKKTCKKCKKELGETYRIDTPNDTGSLYYCPECYQEVKKPILSIVR
jgi:protein-arginine kinase activator protein McsA